MRNGPLEKLSESQLRLELEMLVDCRFKVINGVSLVNSSRFVRH